MSETCQQCGNLYKQLSLHWNRSSDCEYPKLTTHQREVTTGLLMGDGYIEDEYNPRIMSRMTSPKYLEYVDNIFGVMGTGVSFDLSAEDSAKRDVQSGFHTDATAENYSDIYRWTSRSNPNLQEFASWYSSGQKVFPEGIELSPTVLKHWYCGDGHYSNKNGHNCIVISMKNEKQNLGKIDNIFKNADIPAPSNYNIQSNGCQAEFTVSDSKRLFEYMGEPLPDFEYKWPE